LAFTLKEASAALGVGKTTLYAVIADRRLAAVKLRHRTLIPAGALACLARLAASGETSLTVRCLKPRTELCSLQLPEASSTGLGTTTSSHWLISSGAAPKSLRQQISD
jgi:excisionase family DNA binding protein